MKPEDAHLAELCPLIGHQCLSRNETKCTGRLFKPSSGNITASTSICLRLNSPAEIDTRYLVKIFHDKIMQLCSILCCHMLENMISNPSEDTSIWFFSWCPLRSSQGSQVWLPFSPYCFLCQHLQLQSCILSCTHSSTYRHQLVHSEGLF